MHRFGRSAQKRMNDRWGGVLVLALILAVAGAWQLGGMIGNMLESPRNTATNPAPGAGGLAALPGGSGATFGAMPREFQVHFVQVGAFRSEGAARNLVKQLSAAGYGAAVTPVTANGLVKVYVGPYMTPTAATDAKARLMADEAATNPFTVAVTVDHSPDAVMVMTGAPNTELQKGLDALNAYLYEAGRWLAGRTGGQAPESASVAGLGRELNQHIGHLTRADASPQVKEFLAMATMAGENALAIQAAATALPGSDQFQKAMQDYVSLLDRYHQFHAGQ